MAIVLTEKQKEIVEACIEGKNVMIAGSAGSGKSTIIHNVVETLLEMDKDIFVTAATGMASCSIDVPYASTFHAFLGAGKCDTSVNEIIAYYNSMKESKGLKNLETCDVLVIDEISMIHPSLLNKFDSLACKVRACTKPFGGIQVIFCGDFVQLPPVERDLNDEFFAFESDAWARANIHVYVLDVIFRQGGDLQFQSILESMRKGTINPEQTRLLYSRVNATLDTPNNLFPTELYSRTAQVQKVNMARLKALPGDSKIFKAKSAFCGTCRPEVGKMLLAKMFENNRVESELELKVGCAVILTVNLSLVEKLGNGSQGVVTAFEENDPVVRFSNGKVVRMRTYIWRSCIDTRLKKKTFRKDDEIFNGVMLYQIPLIKAFAITIHKSQGLTLDYARMSLGTDVFASGQAYVALSRVRTLAGVSLTSFNPSAIIVNPKVLRFYESYSKGIMPIELFGRYKVALTEHKNKQRNTKENKKPMKKQKIQNGNNPFKNKDNQHNFGIGKVQDDFQQESDQRLERTEKENTSVFNE